MDPTSTSGAECEKIENVDVPNLDGLRESGRVSFAARLERLRSKGWQIGQCAIAAGLAWWLASDVLGHELPFFAPIAAVVCLGTTYGQRLRRVVEISLGVAVGVFIGDVLVAQIGSGIWQLTVIVALAMTVGVLISGSPLFVTQAAVQSIVVTILVPDPGAGFTRWTDAMIGGLVALLAATVVPAAPLRRPREQASNVLRKVSELIRAASDDLKHGQVAPALELLADARSTDALVREMQDAADEGMAAVASSPFRVRHKPGVRRMSELVEPIDRALRSTRVLVRQCAVAAYHDLDIPDSYIALVAEVAEATAQVADELHHQHTAIGARERLLEVGARTGQVERSEVMTAVVILGQLRSIVADLLVLTGLDALEASDAMPPPP